MYAAGNKPGQPEMIPLLRLNRPASLLTNIWHLVGHEVLYDCTRGLYESFARLSTYPILGTYILPTCRYIQVVTASVSLQLHGWLSASLQAQACEQPAILRPTAASISTLTLTPIEPHDSRLQRQVIRYHSAKYHPQVYLQVYVHTSVNKLVSIHGYVTLHSSPSQIHVQVAIPLHMCLLIKRHYASVTTVQ